MAAVTTNGGIAPAVPGAAPMAKLTTANPDLLRKLIFYLERGCGETIDESSKSPAGECVRGTREKLPGK